MESNKYASAPGFRQALDRRLLQQSGEQNVAVNVLRRREAFDSFLRRFLLDGDALVGGGDFKVVLKGGYALQKRLGDKGVRATKDLDFVARALRSDITGESLAPEKKLRLLLQSVCEREVGDYFTFSIGEAAKDLESAGEGGWRFQVESRIAGRTFERFHVDIALGDALVEPVGRLAVGENLSFAGLSRRN